MSLGPTSWADLSGSRHNAHFHVDGVYICGSLAFGRLNQFGFDMLSEEL